MTDKNDIPTSRPELAPPDYCDPVIEAYKKDVDRTLLRENLKLTLPLSRVTPAKAGIQAVRTTLLVAWTLAVAGVTRTS